MPKVVLSRSENGSRADSSAVIEAVTPGSPAARAGVRAGWELLRVNDRPVPDVLAYRHALEGGRAELRVRDPASGQELSFDVAWEEPGLEFEDVIFDGIRLCANKCDFCYIHQMPKGMRKSLYIMDDDFRTSFLYGSFVTLTNLTEDDVARILDEHLSPLYVSVHSTDEALRDGLMRPWPHKIPYPPALRIRDMLERLAPIDLYTQMVVLPGRNDGEALSSTLEALAGYPNVLAVAAVPVGLTAHRAHLPAIEPHTPQQAAAVLERVHAFQRRMLAERGTRFVFASDEFYLRAGAALPDTGSYEGFPMLENGIGMVRDFLDDGLPALPARIRPSRRVLLATGRLFAPVLREAVAPLAALPGLELEVRAIANRTFGEVTTVAGLLAGEDLAAAIEPGEADLVLISPNMLKYGTETFLDDTTLKELEVRLGARLEPGGSTLGALAGSVLSGPAPGGLPSFGFSAHAVKEAAKQH